MTEEHHDRTPRLWGRGEGAGALRHEPLHAIGFYMSAIILIFGVTLSWPGCSLQGCRPRATSALM